MAKAALLAAKSVCGKAAGIEKRRERIGGHRVANGRVLMVGHILRYHPQLLALQTDSDGCARKDLLSVLDRLNIEKFAPRRTFCGALHRTISP